MIREDRLMLADLGRLNTDVVPLDGEVTITADLNVHDRTVTVHHQDL